MASPGRQNPSTYTSKPATSASVLCSMLMRETDTGSALLDPRDRDLVLCHNSANRKTKTKTV